MEFNAAFFTAIMYIAFCYNKGVILFVDAHN